jgi:hypothetical protein
MGMDFSLRYRADNRPILMAMDDIDIHLEDYADSVHGGN